MIETTLKHYFSQELPTIGHNLRQLAIDVLSNLIGSG